MLIWLKNYPNPFENNCSKVISILITGSISHQSSLAQHQHKSVQYKWFALYLHQDVSHTDMLQPHSISFRGISGGRRQHARIQEFLSVLFSPQLILQFKEGFQWFYCLENYTYTLPRIQRRSIIFQGCVHFFQGGGGLNANFYRNPYTYLLFSRGGCPDPLSPLDPHMGNVIITGQYLSQSGF